MNIKEVKKNLADQLMSFQLSGLNQINQMEKEHKKELESLEEKHKKEMKRLVGQETELDRAVRNMKRERRMMIARNEDELKDMKRRHREEKEKKRKENREFSRGKLEEDSRLNRVRQDQERKMLNQNQRAYNSVQDQESVRSLQETLMRINNNWNEMRDVFDSEVRWRIEENSEEERKDVLEGIRKIKEGRTKLRELLLSISRNLGRLKETIREEDYVRTEKNLTSFQQKQSTLEVVLDEEKIKIMRTQLPCWIKTEEIMTECSECSNELLGNRICCESGE